MPTQKKKLNNTGRQRGDHKYPQQNAWYPFSRFGQSLLPPTAQPPTESDSRTDVPQYYCSTYFDNTSMSARGNTRRKHEPKQRPKTNHLGCDVVRRSHHRRQSPHPAPLAAAPPPASRRPRAPPPARRPSRPPAQGQPRSRPSQRRPAAGHPGNASASAAGGRGPRGIIPGG